jgi:two-component system OmpR family sensor kinase/two-component system sensor histidine kinase BaeS
MGERREGWDGSEPWSRRRGRALFLRFVVTFGLIVLLLLAGMFTLALLLARLAGGDGQVAVVVWMAGCGLALALPILALALAVRAFRHFAAPLAEVMSAADAVAAGDWSVRVSERGPRDFRQLARSFNRMTAELARADQQRRNLSADVAHELRTPLQIIQGNLEGILDGVYLADEAHLGATLDETRVLARLVEDLRTLSLAEAGELPMHWEQVDIGELLADLDTTFSGQAEAAGVSMQITPAAETSSAGAFVIAADLGRLNQVLSNLVVNALRHTPAGGSITLAVEAREGGVRMRVSDTGEGIPAEDLPFVFDRFWKGDPARSRSGGAGSGLGLAIARQLVQAHGGQIAVDSRVGQGTSFVIDLPAQHPAAKVAADSTPQLEIH